LSHLPSAKVEVWDIATKHQIAQFDNLATHLEFTPDGKLLAMVGDDMVSLWSTKNWKQQTTRRIDAFVGSFEFSPTGATYAMVGVSKELDDTGRIANYKSWLRVYDTESGEALAEIIGEEREFAFAAYAPDGHTLATFGSGNVRLWKLKLE
jgi:WD40 repeat protein